MTSSHNFETPQTCQSPDEIISRIDSLSERHATPCGEGHMFWRVWGKGRPLVLLHGGYGSWTHWIRNVLTLSEHFMVIAVDTPGLGESDMPPTPYTPMSLAEIIATGLEQMLPTRTRFHLAGFSFGGIIGGHVAALLGKQVATLTLIGAGGLGLPRDKMERLERPRPDMRPEELADLHRSNLEILMLAEPDNVDDLAVHLQTQNTRRARIKSRPISQGDALRRVLQQVRVALKGIWGERDATTGGYLADREVLLRELHPGLEFRIVKGAGHWVAYESPERFNEILLHMLESDAVATRSGRQTPLRKSPSTRYGNL
jgi:pimeloyl-ACP methyl ester carboxylesterase